MEHSSKKKKILIIEDEKTLLAALKSKLMMKGYAVVSSEAGDEGEKMVETEKPDLILLDIVLPKKDGFEILEGLKKKENKIPIIIISNSGQPVEIQKTLDLGARDYLVKVDFTPNEVLEKVEKIIGSGLPPEEEQTKVETLSSQERSGGAASAANFKGMPVLVVEDDEFLRQLVAQKLVQEGFDVLAAIDADAAFAVISEKKPRVILLDLILPGMDGYEVLRRLKEDPATKAVPVIVLSNLGQREDIDKAMAAGAAEYLIKANNTPAEIVERVKYALVNSGK